VPTRRRPTARAAALPARRAPQDLRSYLPTGRSLLVAALLLVAAAGAYAAARTTSVFAVRALDVRGGTPLVRAEVRAALAPEVGRSLLRVGQGDLDRRLATVTGVRTFTYDRAFPHTLRVVVRAERSVLVLRQSRFAYLVSASGRVLRTLQHPRLSNLPRMWVTKTVAVHVGETLPPQAAAGAIAVAPLQDAPLPGGVRTVSNASAGLVLTLGDGFEVRLGDTGDLRLKLAIARRILATTGAATGTGYVDVSVPERPVLSTNSQLGG
jgi:cell division septal protein FtsQ